MGSDHQALSPKEQFLYDYLTRNSDLQSFWKSKALEILTKENDSEKVKKMAELLMIAVASEADISAKLDPFIDDLDKMLLDYEKIALKLLSQRDVLEQARLVAGYPTRKKAIMRINPRTDSQYMIENFGINDPRTMEAINSERIAFEDNLRISKARSKAEKDAKIEFYARLFVSIFSLVFILVLLWLFKVFD
jgi:lipopolysaccharide export LptBFGC system permease protein LptF